MQSATLSRVVMGTAGHVDHGKTALVKALTGVDTDRLKEEKERGITIELGFAALPLPDGRVVSVVDVPGHERFVRNMVAGASGIDFVLFVVAADEGVMPQTREHLDICSLLGVRSGIVVITKCDAVDADFAALAEEEVRDLCAGTFLEEAPFVRVSALTGEGIDTLRAEISRMASKVGVRDAKGLFRLPVDRVFSIKGFGTVVTGTVASGAVRLEEEVALLPSGVRAKVRGLELHGEKVQKGYAGNRLAINLSGVQVEDVSRGDTVIHPGTIQPTRMADAVVSFLSSAGRPVEGRGRFRLHVDTREVPVVMALLDAPVLGPGGRSYVQLRSPELFTVCPGDHFVLRGYSPAVTVGGGRILDSNPKRHKGLREEVARTLAVLDVGEVQARLDAFLGLRGAKGLVAMEAQALLGVTLEEARNLLQAAVRSGRAEVADRKAGLHVDSAFLARLTGQAIKLLEAFHREFPLRKGMGIEEVRSKFPSYVEPRLAAYALERGQATGTLAVEGETVRLSTFKVKLNEDDESLRARILEVVGKAGFEALTSAQVAELLDEEEKGLRRVMDYLVGQGILVRTKENFYFDARVMAALVERVIERMALNGELTVADIKEFTGASRKYVIPLAEFLDSSKVTMRLGERRVPGPKGRKA